MLNKKVNSTINTLIHTNSKLILLLNKNNLQYYENMAQGDGGFVLYRTNFYGSYKNSNVFFTRVPKTIVYNNTSRYKYLTFINNEFAPGCSYLDYIVKNLVFLTFLRCLYIHKASYNF